MSLFTQAEMVASMPASKMLLGMDDDGDSVEDEGLFASILTSAEDFVGGYLDQAGIARWPDPLPARLKTAGMNFALYKLYERRGMQNEMKTQMENWVSPDRTWLSRIANGEESLSPAVTEPDTGGAVVSEPARTTTERGYFLI
jgi:hypothetical protein